MLGVSPQPSSNDITVPSSKHKSLRGWAADTSGSLPFWIEVSALISASPEFDTFQSLFRALKIKHLWVPSWTQTSVGWACDGHWPSFPGSASSKIHLESQYHRDYLRPIYMKPLHFLTNIGCLKISYPNKSNGWSPFPYYYGHLRLKFIICRHFLGVSKGCSTWPLTRNHGYPLGLLGIGKRQRLQALILQIWRLLQQIIQETRSRRFSRC